MWTLSLPLIFWATVVVQLLGVISLVAVRLCHNDRGRLVCQRLFLSALACARSDDRSGRRCRQRLLGHIRCLAVVVDGLCHDGIRWRTILFRPVLGAGEQVPSGCRIS